MNRFFWNIVIAFLWVVFTGHSALSDFLIGFGIGYILIVLAEPKRIGRGYGRQVVRGVFFAAYYLGELLLSNLRVARDVLSPTPGTHPAIVAVHLEEGHTDASITALANLLTMTPGTMSLDVSSDKRWIYIHAMFVEDVDKFRADFKRHFERRILEVAT